MIQEQVVEMLSDFKKMGITTQSVELHLGFSNGLLGKGFLSEEKFKILKNYHSNVFFKKDEEYSYSVYKLINPIDDTIFYVGITRRSLEVRLCGHMGEAISSLGHKKPTKKSAIISNIISQGLAPKIVEIESLRGCDLSVLGDLAIKKEKDWIIKLIEEGHPLTNKYSKLNLLIKNAERLDILKSNEATKEEKEKAQKEIEVVNEIVSRKEPENNSSDKILYESREEARKHCPPHLTGLHIRMWVEDHIIQSQ